MTPTPNQPDPEAPAKRKAAMEIVAHTFSAGLGEICNPHFLAKRYSEFLSRDDPIYVNLLQGMNDDPLSKTFVSYWTIAQTLATQSRFWLEDAVAEIISSQVKQFGRPATHVYSQRMLGHGYMDRNVTVADLGEKCKEHLTDRRSWRPPMKANALKEADVLVGEQERERINAERRQKPFLRRTWDEAEGGEATARDIAPLKRMADAVSGDAINDVAIQCNLLVIEPDKNDGKPHAFAIRFINSKTIASHAQRKQERVNLLRLYAYLVQEKLFRTPTAIHVCVAELIPRMRSDFDQYDHHPDYFSAHTYWPAASLWKFIGVPFDVVSEAVRRVGREFRDRLKDGLRFLLPESEAPEKWGEPQRGRKKSRGMKQAAEGGLFPAGEIEAEGDRRRFLALMQKWHADHPRADQVRHCENVARLLSEELKKRRKRFWAAAEELLREK